MSYLLDELEVLQESRTALSDGQRVLVIIAGMTLVGGHIVWHILCVVLYLPSYFSLLAGQRTPPAEGLPTSHQIINIYLL